MDELDHIDSGPLPPAPGARLRQQMIDGGAPQDQVEAWKANLTRQMLQGGAPPKEVESYWGDSEPDMTKVGHLVESNWELLSQDQKMKVASSPGEAFQAGWDYSATSLLIRPQEHLLPQDASLGQKIMFGLGMTAGDFPIMVAGAFGGIPVGAAVGTATAGPAGTVPGAVLGSGFGSNAAPELTRQVMLDYYKHQESTAPFDFRDAAARAAHITWETVKAGTIGLVGVGVGGKVGAAVEKIGAPTAVKVGAEVTSAAVAMTATGAALDGHIPTVEDFATGAILMLITAGGIKAAGYTVGATKRFVMSDRAKEVQQNVQDIYAKTGIDPRTLSEMAKRDPVIMQEVLAPRSATGNRTTPTTEGHSPPEVTPYYRPKIDVKPIEVKGAVDPDLVPPEQLNLMRKLEGSRDDAVSSAGAIGRYQIMPGTAKYYGLDPSRLKDPAYNEQAARAVLADLNEKFDGNIPDILVAYNAGPGRAKMWIKGGRKLEDLPLETQKYLEHAERLGAIDGDFNGRATDRQLSIKGEPDWSPPGGKPPGPPKPPGGELGEPLEGGEGPKLSINADMAEEIILDGIAGRTEKGNWDVVNPRRYLAMMQSELEVARTLDDTLQPRLNLKPDDITIEDMLRQTYASKDRASYFIRLGTIEPLEFKQTSSDYYIKGFEQVKEDGGTVPGFTAWRLARRQQEKLKQGIDIGVNQKAADVLVADKGRNAMYERGNATIQRVKDAAVDYFQESGRLTKDQAARMKELNREHIVMHRFFDDKYVPPAYRGPNKFMSTKTLKKIEGSERQIIDPVMADMDNIHFMIALADMNRAVGDIVGRIEALSKGMSPAEREALPITKVDADIAKAQDQFGIKATVDGKPVKAELLDQNGKPIKLSKEAEAAVDDLIADKKIRDGLKQNQFVYYRDGKPEVWEAKDPALVDLLAVRYPGKMNPLAELMVTFARVARAGIVLAPDFPFRSSIVGEMAKASTEKYRTIPFRDVGVGTLELFRNGQGDLFKEWLRAGGGGAALADIETKYLMKDMQKLMESTGTESALYNTFRHPIEALEALSHWIDTAGRLGTYQRLVNDRKLPAAKAAMETRLAHLDHAEPLAQAWVNSLSRMVPFSKTMLKDIEQFGRAVKERPVTALTLMAALVTLPTVLNWMVNKLIDQSIPDDRARERYSELPQWQRDSYIVLPPVAGVRMRISRTYTAGYLGGALVERFLDAMWDQEKLSPTDLMGAVTKWLLPMPIPNAAVPVAENWANKSILTGRPVVPASLEANTGYMQYSANTTETAKAIAYYLGPPGLGPTMGKDLSPIWIEEYVRQWTGSMPMKLLRILEKPYAPPGRPDEIADLPFVGSFFARTPTTDAESIGKFYDELEEVSKKQRDFKTAIGRSDIEDMEIAADLNIPVNVIGIANVLRNQSAIVKAINQDADMTDDEKRGYTDVLVSNMIQMAQTGSSMIKQTKQIMEEQ